MFVYDNGDKYNFSPQALGNALEKHLSKTENKENRCKYTRDANGYWFTECENLAFIYDDAFDENNIKFCSCCGEKIEVRDE
jgi:hypothetical protein